MTLKEIMKHKVFLTGIVFGTASVLFWLLGVESISRPIFADEFHEKLLEVDSRQSQHYREYTMSLNSLNAKQLSTQKEFARYKLQRIDAQLLDVEEKKWDARRTNVRTPEYLTSMEQELKIQKSELEAEVQNIHAQELNLLKTAEDAYQRSPIMFKAADEVYPNPSLLIERQ